MEGLDDSSKTMKKVTEEGGIIMVIQESDSLGIYVLAVVCRDPSCEMSNCPTNCRQRSLIFSQGIPLD